MPFDTQKTPAAQAGTEDLEKRRVARGQPDLNEGGTAAQGFEMAREAIRPGQAAVAQPGNEEPTPEEQAEYERAVKALGKVLYENEQTSASIVKQMSPQEKIGSIAKASMLVVQQMDGKLDLDEVVIPQFTQEVVDRTIDLYENAYDEEVTEGEAQKILGATWEGVMEMYGVNEESYAELTAGMGRDEFKSHEQQYKQFLGEA